VNRRNARVAAVAGGREQGEQSPLAVAEHAEPGGVDARAGGEEAQAGGRLLLERADPDRGWVGGVVAEAGLAAAELCRSGASPRRPRSAIWRPP